MSNKKIYKDGTAILLMTLIFCVGIIATQKFEAKNSTNLDENTHISAIDKKGKFIENVHWSKLSNPQFIGKNNVDNFFWFACKHCKDMYSNLKPLFEGSGLIVRHHPVVFGAAVLDARDYFAMQHIGLTEDTVMGYMDYRQSKDWEVAGLKGYLELIGVSEDKVNQALSYSRGLMASARVEDVSRLIESSKIKAVPALTVSGKYLINLQNLSGSYQELFSLISYLAEKQP